MEDMKLKGNDYCFACGQSNPIGLHLKFRWEDGEYVAEFVPKKEHEGFARIVHGGLLATVLDESMARMLWEMGKNAVTAEITVKLNKVVRPGDRLSVRARLVREDRRLLHCSAEARGEAGLVAEARGKFLRL